MSALPGAWKNIWMMSMIEERYLSRLRQLTTDGRRHILGLVGAPGAGKSTLSQAILDAFPGKAVIVPMDGFHLANVELARLYVTLDRGVQAPRSTAQAMSRFCADCASSVMTKRSTHRPSVARLKNPLPTRFR
jgi:pantothenate kinase